MSIQNTNAADNLRAEHPCCLRVALFLGLMAPITDSTINTWGATITRRWIASCARVVRQERMDCGRKMTLSKETTSETPSAAAV
jgi:hypothetical protein